MSDLGFRPYVYNTESQITAPQRIAAYLTTKKFLALMYYWKYTIIFILFPIFAVLIACTIVYWNGIEAWFQSMGPPLEKWFRDPKNDWMYLILLVILLQVYKKYPAFFAPLTCVVVMGLMVLLCFQYNNFNTTEVVNQWLIIGLFVLPVPPLIAVIVKTKTVFLHWGAILTYIAMVALVIIINPGNLMGKFATDNATVYIVGFIGLFSMVCVYLNKNFTKQLWPNYITQLGFVIICLLTAAFTFQYAVRFFMQKPNFSANYLVMLAVIVGFVLLFFKIVLMRIRIPESWRASRLIFFVLFCSVRDFVVKNSPMAFYILLAEIALILWYVFSTKAYKKIQEGDKGKQMLNEPVSLRVETNQAVPFEFKANYAISFWLYLVPQPREHDPSSSVFMNVMDYGGKPKVTYNSSTNTLRITVQLPSKNGEKSKEEIKKVRDDAYQTALDTGLTEKEATAAGEKAAQSVYYNNMGEEVLMADLTKIPLQRWHHIVLAYNNGVFDIFLNGVLYRSIPGVMTDLTGTSLLLGSSEGNRGKICNLVFYQGGTDVTKTFTKNGIAITSNKVENLYNNFVNKNPPIVSRIFSISPDPSYAQVRVNPVIF
jgi:hypothetical protein